MERAALGCQIDGGQCPAVTPTRMPKSSPPSWLACPTVLVGSAWRVLRSAKTDFVLDALEQALHDRQHVQKGGLIQHSDRGGQYLSIRYTERLAEAGIEP